MHHGRCLSLTPALLLFASLIALPLTADAQGQREIDMIAEIGVEEVKQREAEAQRQAELADQQRLEEASRLRAAYAEYLGAARRAAQVAIKKKRGDITQEQVDSLRRQARIIIDEVDDATKQRVRTELDPIYQQLEAAIALTQDELFAADPRLVQLRRRLAPGGGRELDWVDNAAILYALCADDQQAKVIAGNIPHREKLSEDEARGMDLTNRRRLVLGLEPLAIDMKLVACCRDHSKDMVEKNFFSHTSPVPGKTTPWDRAKNFGTSASGENIAAGYGNGAAVVMGWWYSPGHLKNMMGKSHVRIAIGQMNQTYTQMFGR